MDEHTPESLLMAMTLGATLTETPEFPLAARRYFLGDQDVTRAFKLILMDREILWDDRCQVWYYSADGRPRDGR